MWCYAGLPFSPRLVYCTGPPRLGRCPPGSRPTACSGGTDSCLGTVWDSLGPKMCALLDAYGMLWTSLDVVPSADAGAWSETASRPVRSRHANKLRRGFMGTSLTLVRFLPPYPSPPLSLLQLLLLAIVPNYACVSMADSHSLSPSASRLPPLQWYHIVHPPFQEDKNVK